MEYHGSDRVLMIVADTTILGSTRLQKYGFLLYKQYERELLDISRDNRELKFYDDWKPYWYGPFSEILRKDISACVDEHHLVYKEMADQSRNLHAYSLTIRGRVRWRQMLDALGPEMTAIHGKIMNLQRVRLERLLEGVYNLYPEYTKRSVIKGRF